MEFIGQTESFGRLRSGAGYGIIKKVFLAESRDVERGEKLYLIDPFLLRRQSQCKGRVGQALARLAQARAELARVTPLLAEQAVSQKDVDDAVAEKFGAEAALVTAKGDWEKAKFDLQNTRIVAPVAGRPERSRLYEGRLVSAQTDLLTSIHQMDPMYVNVNIPESYILRRQRELAAHRVERPDLFPTEGEMTMADGPLSTRRHLGFAGIRFRAETAHFRHASNFPMRASACSGDGTMSSYPCFRAVRRNSSPGVHRRDDIGSPGPFSKAPGVFLYVVDEENKWTRRSRSGLA